MTEGIITAANAEFYEGLIWWHRSLSYYEYPHAVFDLGLTEEQRAECERLQINLLTPEISAPVRALTEWQKWCKPLLVAQSPFQRTLWVDCDALIIRSPYPLFEYLERKPLLTADPCYPNFTTNHPALYQLLSINGPVHENFGCNSGIVGVDLVRDKTFVAAWKFIVEQAAVNPAIRQGVTLHDQGCANWAANYAHCAELCGVIGWNYPADSLIADLQRRRRYDKNRNVIDQVRNEHGCAVIVHWLARPKLWECWQ